MSFDESDKSTVKIIIYVTFETVVWWIRQINSENNYICYFWNCRLMNQTNHRFSAGVALPCSSPLLPIYPPSLSTNAVSLSTKTINRLKQLHRTHNILICSTNLKPVYMADFAGQNSASSQQTLTAATENAADQLVSWILTLSSCRHRYWSNAQSAMHIRWASATPHVYCVVIVS